MAVFELALISTILKSIIINLSDLPPSSITVGVCGAYDTPSDLFDSIGFPNMQLLRENYLNVSYSARSGLKLRWNFHDFLKTAVYFHHLFVVATHRTSELSELL